MWYLCWEQRGGELVGGERSWGRQEEERQDSERKVDRGASLRWAGREPAARSPQQEESSGWASPVGAPLSSRSPERRQRSLPGLPCTPVPDSLLPVPPVPSTISLPLPAAGSSLAWRGLCPASQGTWGSQRDSQRDGCLPGPHSSPAATGPPPTGHVPLQFRFKIHASFAFRSVPGPRLSQYKNDGRLFCQEDLPWLLHHVEAPRRPRGPGIGRPGQRAR